MKAPKPRVNGPVKVLVLADAPVLQMIVLTLNHGVFATLPASSTRDALQIIDSWRPHLLIVDIGMDAGEAMKLVGRADPRGATIPTIGLTRRGDIRTKLAAFERGADDIVTIPFAPEELVARVISLMRRSYGDAVELVRSIAIRGLQIDVMNQEVRAGTSRLRLTAIEQALLYLLASNAGRTLSREEILDTVWGRDYAAESNVVDRHMRNLRSKLGDSWRNPRYISTVPGRGYRFVGETAAPAEAAK
jgi:DNA-binding response OmpR family regulator